MSDDSRKTISRKILSCHRKSRIFQIYQSSSVVVVTGLPARGMRNSGSSPRQGKDIFIYSKPPRWGVGQSHSRIKYEWGVLSPGVDRPRCEVDQSPPPSVKLKNEWSYTFIYTYVLRRHAKDFGFICNIKKLTDSFYCFGYIPWL